MQDLRLLSLTDLMDLLVTQTQHHIRLNDYGSAEQRGISREVLKEIQEEINLRKAGSCQESELNSKNIQP